MFLNANRKIKQKEKETRKIQKEITFGYWKGIEKEKNRRKIQKKITLKNTMNKTSQKETNEE